MAETSDSDDRRREIERILKLVTDGKLTTVQAAELIAAVDPRETPSAEPAVGAGQTSSDASRSSADERRPSGSRGADREFDPDFDDDFRGAGQPGDRDDERRRRRRHRRHRHRHHHEWSGVNFGDAEGIGDDIERAVEFGTRTLRSVFGQGFGRSAFWDDPSNSSVLSHARAPTGNDFKCEGNHFAVSNVNGIRLTRSTFSNNHVNAADVAEVELVDSQFTDQHVRGSSLRQLLGENAEIRGNELNGAQWSRMTFGKARVENNLTNGSQLRDIGISDSVLEESRFNGTKLKTLVINAQSHVKELDLNGVLGRNWLLESAAIADSRFNGMRVDGLVMKKSGLDGVTFSRQDYSPRLNARGLGLMRDFSMQNVVLKNCTFEDCVFDGTRFEGFDASNLSFEGVDFTGLVVTTAADLERLAGGRRVA